MELSPDLFNKIIRDLEQHEESKRIKKLIFYACKNYWENDLNKLNQFSLENLIQELFERNTTIEKLTDSLYRIVETLNRQELYIVIADLILMELGEIYNRNSLEEEYTKIVTTKAYTANNNNQITDDFFVNKVAKSLEVDREANRITKLIFFACKNHWETDINIIKEYSLKDLIVELQELYPTLDILKQSLYSLVATLNRKNVYHLIADIIISKIKPLYQNKSVSINSDLRIRLKSNPSQSGAQEEVTGIAPVKLELEKNLTIIEPVKVANQGNLTSIASFDDLEKPQQRSISTQDMFELRLQLMQYTNPLRTKILLYSIIYQKFDNYAKYLSMLRTYTLDELLSRVFYKYKTIEELESQLGATNKSILEPDVHLQTVTAIIETMKPIYNHN
ncbi:MAG: hypothetical protein AB4038_16370 [Prochloraceae cyanobacterium]